MKKFYSVLFLLSLVLSISAKALASDKSEYVFAYELLTQNTDLTKDIKNAHLILSNIDGTQTKVLETLTWEQQDMLVDIYSLYYFKWSPDGTILAVSNEAPDPNKAYDYSLRFYTNTGELIRENPRSFEVYDLSWVPGTHTIVFKDTGNGIGQAIVQYDVDTDHYYDVVQGTITNTFNSLPTVSPDLSKMFFTHQEWGTDEYSLIVNYGKSFLPYGQVDFYNKQVDSRVQILCHNKCWGDNVFWSLDSKRIFLTGNGMTVITVETRQSDYYQGYCSSPDKFHESDIFVCLSSSEEIWTKGIDDQTDAHNVILNIKSLNGMQEDINSYQYSGVANLPGYVRISPDDKMILFTGLYDNKPNVWITETDGSSYWEVQLPTFKDEKPYAVESFDW